jgi:hypothetical protein
VSRRPIVKRHCHFLAVKVDLQDAIDRLPDNGELVERGLEQTPLRITADNRDQNNEAGMQRLRRVKLLEIARVVGNENKIAVARVAPTFQSFQPARPTCATCWASWPDSPGSGDQVDAEAFVDQKPHDTAMVSSFRRPRRTGC